MGMAKLAAVAVIVAVTVRFISNWIQCSSNVGRVEGYFHPHFREVAEIFRQNVQSGKEMGGSFSVYYKGQLLVDLWGGYADKEADQWWTNDTLTVVFSASKGVVSLVAAKMVERQWLDYKKPVSYYWPEFGKENITVEMLLNHKAGLPFLDTPVNLLDVRDNRSHVETILANQKPAWKPGSTFGYHALTFGLYVDTLLQKAHPQKKKVSQIFEEEIGQPFGIEFFFGLPKTLTYRAARLQETHSMFDMLGSVKGIKLFWSFMRPGSPLMKAAQAIVNYKSGMLNNPEIRTVGLSSMMGFSSAKNLAKLYGILANGGTFEGKQLLKPDTIDQLQKVYAEGTDEVIYLSHRRSLGLLLDTKVQGSAGHSGFGGQEAFMDVKQKIGLAYVTNFLRGYPPGEDPRFVDLQEATYHLLQTYSDK